MTRQLGRAAARKRVRHQCPSRYKRLLSRAAGVCIVLVGCLRAGRAAADLPFRLAVDWEKLGVLLQREDAEPRYDGRPAAGRSQHQRTARSLLDAASASDRWSLIARDWNEARPLVGPPTASDEVKTWRSRRMVLMRVKPTRGPLAPFAQIGLGQWRIDPNAPTSPHVSLTAGQLGIGIAYALGSSVSIVVQADCTLLEPGPVYGAYAQTSDHLEIRRSLQGSDWVHPSVLWGSLFAARLRF